MRNPKLLFELFDSKNHNQSQKIGLFLAVLSFLLIVALHNPIHGYQAKQLISSSDVSIAKVPKFLMYSSPELDFLEWRSIGASVDALKSIGALITWLSVDLLALINNR